MSPQARRSTWAAPVADAALLLALLAAPLSVGGVYLWSQLTVWTLVLVGVLASLWHSHLHHRGLPLPGILAIPVLLCGLMLVQLVPLPAAVIGWLSPQADATLSTTLGSMGRYGFHSLSLDPAATWGELGKIGLLGLLLLLGYHRRCRQGGARRVVGMVALSGVAVLVVTVVQTLGNVQKIYGLFGYVDDRLLHTPFVNPNHAAAFFGMTSCAAMGMAIRHRDRVRAALWTAAAVGLAATTILTLSRGGMLALLGAAALLSWLLFRQNRSSLGVNSVIALSLIAVLALASYLGLDAIEAELMSMAPDQLSSSKATIWADALSMAWAFFAVGVGRGAFGTVFTQFDKDAALRRPLYAESWPVQLAADFGVPVALLLVALTCALLVIALTRVRKTHQIAALTGLFFVGVQNLADFSIEMLGVAAPAVALLAALSPRPRRRGDSAARSWWHSFRFSMRPWQGATVTAVLAVLVIASLVHAQQHDGQSLRQAIAAEKNAARRGQIAAHGLIEHPADYRFAYSIAQSALTQQPPDPDRALRWVNRTLYLNPVEASAYRFAAWLLWKRGARPQALENWRRCARLRPSSATDVIKDLLSTELPAVDLLDGVPPDLGLRLCLAARQGRGPSQARDCINALIAADTNSTAVLQTAAQWSLSERDLPRAQSLVQRLATLDADNTVAAVLQGKIAMAMGQEQAALDLWTQRSGEVRDPWPLFRELHLHATSRKAFVLARTFLQRMRSSARHDATRSALESLYEARLYLRQNQLARALRAIELTLILRPGWLTAMITQVQCLEALQRYSQALQILEKIRNAKQSPAWVTSSLRRIADKQTQQKQRVQQRALETAVPPF